MRIRILTATTLVALLAVGTIASADAATMTSWKAPLGSAGANGYTTLVTTSAGLGTIRVVAKHLTARATYPVELRSGSCTGPKLFGLTSVVASTTGTIVKSYPISAARVMQLLHTPRLYVRIGSSTRVRCGRFALVVPTGATSGTTVKVPASAYGDATHLHTVQAFEPWADPAGLWVPDAGDIFVTALVRVDAGGPMTYNLFDYHVRDSSGLQYSPTIGRAPILGSGDLVTGGFVAGWVTFEVPAAVATSLTLVYSPSLGTTVLIRLTALPYAATSPTPTATPPPPCILGCMGQTFEFGGYTVTVDSVAIWPGTATLVPPPGQTYVAVHVTEVIDAGIPNPISFTIAGGGLTGFGPAPVFVQPTDIAAHDRINIGYVTFEVPAAAVGSLSLTINGSVVVRLY